MEALLPRILLPDSEVLLNVNTLYPVQRHYIEIPDRAVILRRIPGGGDEPALRKALVSECLALEKLQHHGSQCLGDAVDFIQKKNPLPKAGFLHQTVNRGQNFAHSVLRNGVFLSAVNPLFNERQAHGALTCVMSNGIGHQTHPGFGGNLLHNLGFTHAGRAHQQNGTLADRRNSVISEGVLGKIGFQSVGDFLFGLFDVHKS